VFPVSCFLFLFTKIDHQRDRRAFHRFDKTMGDPRWEEEKRATTYRYTLFLQGLYTLSSQVEQELGVWMPVRVNLITFLSVPLVGKAQDGIPRDGYP